MFLQANKSFVAIETWKDRAISFSSLADYLLDLSYMGPQLQFIQDLFVKGDLDEIMHALAPGVNLTGFESLDVTHLETELGSSRVRFDFIIFLIVTTEKYENQILKKDRACV